MSCQKYPRRLFISSMRALALALLLTLNPLTTTSLQAATFEEASLAYQSQRYDLAFLKFSELAGDGDPKAQTVLAIMYRYGEGVRVDHKTAFQWYKQAAEQNYSAAQFSVAEMLLNGIGTQVDKEEAVYWLKKSATAGFSRAVNLLASIEADTGTREMKSKKAWSQHWNLRLPNEIREENSKITQPQYRVFRAQLGSMRNRMGAERLWQQIIARDEQFFGTMQPIFSAAVAADQEVFRLQVGSFESRQTADQFCNEVLKRNLSEGCLVLMTN